MSTTTATAFPDEDDLETRSPITGQTPGVTAFAGEIAKRFRATGSSTPAIDMRTPSGEENAARDVRAREIDAVRGSVIAGGLGMSIGEFHQAVASGLIQPSPWFTSKGTHFWKREDAKAIVRRGR